MPGPHPKPQELRQRQNKKSTRATLDGGDVKRIKKPALPKGRDWHPLTRAFWKDIWDSPMAPEFLQSDLHGLYVLADLVDQYWSDPKPALAAEIRLQRQCFGLSPLDRRRLEWEVQRAESSKGRHAQPKKKEPLSGDPREYLKEVL